MINLLEIGVENCQAESTGRDEDETVFRELKASIQDGAPGILPKFWEMSEFWEARSFERGDDHGILVALNRALDRSVEHFERGMWLDGIQLQEQAVALARRRLAVPVWSKFAKIDCVSHPLREFLHQDPFTRRSFQKPRGYAGDAVLIDYIYGITHPEHDLLEATPLGRWAFAYTSNTAAPRAVRRRMHLIAELIDRVSSYNPHARILSVAGGHMRELLSSHAARAGIIGQIVAFDRDALSLAAVEEMGIKCVKTVQGSVSRLIAGQYEFSDFDLIYAAGLFDYLEVRPARQLVEVMFRMLKPGGALLIANFLPDIDDVGYMESWMGWDLIFRDRSQIISLVEGIGSAIGRSRYFEESERNIGFLLVRKAG